jgi:hypothetical protein
MPRQLLDDPDALDQYASLHLVTARATETYLLTLLDFVLYPTNKESKSRMFEELCSMDDNLQVIRRGAPNMTTERNRGSKYVSAARAVTRCSILSSLKTSWSYLISINRS